jgi:hypothetical protein
MEPRKAIGLLSAFVGDAISTARPHVPLVSVATIACPCSAVSA